MCTSQFEQKTKSLKDQFILDQKKQKESWMIAEKAKREAWATNKAKELKEVTIRGLEPHIQRLMQRHRTEIERCEAKHETQLRIKLDELRQCCEKEKKEIESQLLKDHAEAVQRLESVNQSRLSEMEKRVKNQVTVQHMRVIKDLTAQIESMEASHRQDRKKLQMDLQERMRESAQREEEMRAKVAATIQEISQQKEAEFEMRKGMWEEEKSKWKHSFEESMAVKLQQMENEMKERATAERDEEIDVVITRMEDENAEAKSQMLKEMQEATAELQKSHRLRMKEMEGEIAKLTSKYQEALEGKVNALQAKSAAEDHARDLKEELFAKDEKVAELEKEVHCPCNFWKVAELEKELDAERAKLRGLQASVQEEQRVQEIEKVQQIECLQMRLQACSKEIEQMKLQKADELAEVERRVKQVISQKDDIINNLRQRMDATSQQLAFTEKVLYQQKKEILEHPNL